MKISPCLKFMEDPNREFIKYKYYGENKRYNSSLTEILNKMTLDFEKKLFEGAYY